MAAGLEVLLLDGGVTAAAIGGAVAEMAGYRQKQRDDEELAATPAEVAELQQALREKRAEVAAVHTQITKAWRAPLSLFDDYERGKAAECGVPESILACVDKARRLVDEVAELTDLADSYVTQLGLVLERDHKGLMRVYPDALVLRLEDLAMRLQVHVGFVVHAREVCDDPSAFPAEESRVYAADGSRVVVGGEDAEAASAPPFPHPPLPRLRSAGPGSKAPKSQVCCLNGHELTDLGSEKSHGRWKCNGSIEYGGCAAGLSATEFSEHRGVQRFNCKECDYDLCGSCFDVKAGALPLSILRDRGTLGELFRGQAMVFKKAMKGYKGTSSAAGSSVAASGAGGEQADIAAGDNAAPLDSSNAEAAGDRLAGEVARLGPALLAAEEAVVADGAVDEEREEDLHVEKAYMDRQAARGAWPAVPMRDFAQVCSMLVGHKAKPYVASASSAASSAAAMWAWRRAEEPKQMPLDKPRPWIPHPAAAGPPGVWATIAHR